MIATKTVTVPAMKYEGVQSVLTHYGRSETMSVKKNYTDYFNNAFVSFLRECGVSSAKYEDDFLWINGLPISFRITNASSSNISYQAPLTTSGLTVGSWFGGSANTNETPLYLYFAGNDKTFMFSFSLNSKIVASTLYVVNGRNVATGTKAVGFFWYYTTTGGAYGTPTTIFPYNFDSQGNIESYGTKIAANGSPYTLLMNVVPSSYAEDFTRYKKLPLRHQFTSFFEFDSYMNPGEFEYRPSGSIGANHTVLEIDGEKYVLLPLLGFVKM